jgi:RNA ligase
MTLIEHVLDPLKLRSHVQQKLVAEQSNRFWKHIKIYNYGRSCQFDNTLWDEVTEQTRGLIVDWDSGEVLARPFRKFFNLGTGYRPETDRKNLPPFEPECTKKMDGSLGILWWHDGEPQIATRGSFGSAQSRWAEKFFKANYGFTWPDGWTPLFEIIYPGNRIVVKYEREEMVLLGMVNIATGEEMRHSELRKWAELNGCPIVELFNDKSIEELALEDNPNEEGYVITWKVKVKFIEYCRIHRLVTGLSPKGIWELMREGQNLEEEFATMPEHFRQWSDEWIDKFTMQYAQLEADAALAWLGKPDTADRKELAFYFTKYPFPIPHWCFAKLDGKDGSDAIWKAIRPKPEEAFDSAVVEV